MDIKEVLGEDFATKYKGARVKFKELELNDMKQIMKMIKSGQMDPKTGSMFYLKDKFRYEVVLVETLKEIRSAPTKREDFNRVAVKWVGNWLNVFISSRDLEKIQPNNSYILIGNMKHGTWNGKESLTFFNKAIITMEEMMMFDEKTESVTDANSTTGA